MSDLPEKEHAVTEEDDGREPTKRRIMKIAAVTVVLVVLSAIGIYAFYHNWAPASCVEPETCKICGQTHGDALGHDWEEATCEKAKTCRRCNETAGDSLGHKWEIATCTEPKTCGRCSKTKGEELGHDVTSWTTVIEAVCTEEGKRRGTCNRCKQEVVDAIPKVAHSAGDWQIVQDVSLSMYGEIQPGVEAQLCTYCGKELGTREYDIDVTTSQANANKQAMQGLRSMHLSYEGLIRQLCEYEGFVEEEARFAADHCGADWNSQAVDKAEDMMRYQGYSRTGLIEELTKYDLFTVEQAEYAAGQVGL